mmetsp:Transcript_31219/g.68371  ORF Transcript_31219/g.68371 Transcript_31219/m.68371 type:complete len:295 (+) Transcript_31219:627-1511(+)
MQDLDVELLPGNLGLMGDGEEVEHRISAAANCVDHHDSVLQRLPRDNLARADALLEQREDRLCRGGAVGTLLLSDGAAVLARHCGVTCCARKSDTQGFHRRGHGASGKHSTTSAAAREGRAFHCVQLLQVYEAAPVRTDSLHHGAGVKTSWLLVATTRSLFRHPWQGWAAEEGEADKVLSCQRHHDSRDTLITAAKGDDRVRMVALVHDLDAIANVLAADQRVAHATSALRLAVADHRRYAQVRLATQLLNFLGQDVRQVPELVVARHRVAEGRRNGDDRLLKIIILPTRCAEV